MKVVTFGSEARQKLKNGVDLIANAVKVTLGPRGKNTIYGFHYGYPVSTKDGVTVAKQVESKDQTEQLGLLLVRQVAQKTADDAGDGTTTATILAQEIFTEGLKGMQSGANPILIKRGIDKAVEEVVAFIDKVKQEVASDEDILKVASLSANNDRAIGEIINEAVRKVGKDGVITIEDNYQGPETYVEVMEGMQVNEGMISPFFLTDTSKGEAIYQNAYILIIDGDIYNLNQIKPILEEAFKTGRPVLLISNSIHGGVLSKLVESKMKNNVPIVCIKSPYFANFRTEQLTDIAILTGGSVIGDSTGLRLEDATIGDLGQCDSIRSTRFFTTIVGGRGSMEFIKSRIELIKTTIDKSESDYEKEKLQERLSKLTSGVAVIKVGAPSEVEQKDKKFRVEDALLATRAAIEEGIVAGGGLTLLKATTAITENGEEEELIGRRIIKKALRAPIKQIASNAGIDGAEIIARIIPSIESQSGNFGYNFLTNKFCDLMDAGVIDPVKVVKATIVNAASVASLLLTTEVVINEEEELEVARTPKPRTQ